MAACTDVNDGFDACGCERTALGMAKERLQKPSQGEKRMMVR
jgi:hypothetical protein